MSLTSQTASEHAPIPPSLTFDDNECRVGGGLVVLDLGFIVIGINETAKLILQRLTDRQRFDPDRLWGSLGHAASIIGRWNDAAPG